MIETDFEAPADVGAREVLLDRVFGPQRRRRTCERLRAGLLPAAALVARADGAVIGTVRLWDIAAGVGRPALLLGPIAVASEWRGDGVGTLLIAGAVNWARILGHTAILLVGDPGYYGRFGFRAAPAAGLWLPGPFERHRLMALELQPGALDGAAGVIIPTGRPDTGRGGADRQAGEPPRGDGQRRSGAADGGGGRRKLIENTRPGGAKCGPAQAALRAC